MAQKGMSLNPGADPTLVAAAYRAGMANVPKDLSGTFEALAKSYGDTMKSVSESWGNTIKTVAKLGAPLIKQAIKDNIIPITSYGYMYEDRPGFVTDIPGPDKDTEISVPDAGTDTYTYGSTGAVSKKTGKPIDITQPEEYKKIEEKTVEKKLEPMSLADRFREIRKELRSLGVKQDKDSKIRRHELKTERAHLFSNLEFLENTDNFTNDNLAKGLVDLDASGKMAVLMQSALSAYKTKSGKIIGGPNDGFYVTLASDENDDFNFILRNANGDIVTGEGLDGQILTEKGGTPFSISMNDMSSNLIPKIDQKVLDTVGKGFNKLLNSNAPTYSKTGHRNWMAGFVQDEASLFGIMQHALGSSNTSWVEDLNGGVNGEGSEESAKIFAGMGKAKLEKMGVKDTDNDGDIDKDDFTGAGVATTNYKIVKDALLNRKSGNYEFKTTQRMFLDYSDRIGEDMHKFVPAVNKNKNNNKSGGSTNPAWNNQWKSFEDQDRKLQTAMTGGDIRDWGNFLWKSADGGKTYSAEGSDKPEHNNINVVDLLGGHQFGLSNRPLYANLQKKTVFGTEGTPPPDVIDNPDLNMWIPNEKSVSVRLPWEVVNSNVKKTGGIWYIEKTSTEGTYPRKKEWVKASEKEIAKINKEYN